MEIAVASGEDTDLNSLYRWLVRDGDVVSACALSLGSSGRRTGVQSPLDIINVVLSNSTAIASLLISYSTWRRTPPGKSSITLKVDGVEISVDDADDETIQRVIDVVDRRTARPVTAEETPAE